MTTNQIASWVILFFALLLFLPSLKADDRPWPLEKPFKVKTIYGTEVTVIHVGNTWKEIRDAPCGDYKFKRTRLGCADVANSRSTTIRVWSPNPFGLGHKVWLHEVGAVPNGKGGSINSPVFGHAEGMTHDRESEEF